MRQTIAALTGAASSVACFIICVMILINGKILVTEPRVSTLILELGISFTGAVLNIRILKRWLDDIRRDGR